jgi:hypothetical protein
MHPENWERADLVGIRCEGGNKLRERGKAQVLGVSQPTDANHITTGKAKKKSISLFLRRRSIGHFCTNPDPELFSPLGSGSAMFFITICKFTQFYAEKWPHLLLIRCTFT